MYGGGLSIHLTWCTRISGHCVDYHGLERLILKGSQWGLGGRLFETDRKNIMLESANMIANLQQRHNLLSFSSSSVKQLQKICIFSVNLQSMNILDWARATTASFAFFSAFAICLFVRTSWFRERTKK